jgi:hypothetical protein
MALTLFISLRLLPWMPDKTLNPNAQFAKVKQRSRQCRVSLPFVSTSRKSSLLPAPPEAITGIFTVSATFDVNSIS